MRCPHTTRIRERTTRENLHKAVKTQGSRKEITKILKKKERTFHFSSVARLCLTLCDSMDYSMPGFPVPHHLPEFFQIHVHQISDVIQPSRPLPPSSPFAFNLSQHQSFPMSQLFASGGQSTGVSASALVLSVNIQSLFSLGLTGLISLPFKGLSRIFSSTTIQKHQLFSIQPSLWSNFHICT